MSQEVENKDIAELTPKQNKMIATYVQRAYLELQKVKTEKQLDEMPHHLGIYWNGSRDTPLDLLKHVIYNAFSRKDFICDYDDSNIPQEIMAKCQYENHYENYENVELTDEEQEKFDEIAERKGYYKAQKAFDDKFNPVQKLQLILNYDDDNHKLDPDNGEYVCEVCLEEISDNSDGYVSCDMEDYESD